MIGVYKITNTINNKCYIGESCDIERRWEEHKEALEDGTHHSWKLQQDWNEYHKNNFIFEVVEIIESGLTMATQKLVSIVYEDKYIKQYNSIENGYNIEYTLEKMIKGEKEVFLNAGINTKNIWMLKHMIENINKNNGKYIQTYNAKKSALKKNKKLDVILSGDDDFTFRDCIDYFRKNGFQLLYTYGQIFTHLRNANIFYYNNKSINIPYKKYIDLYFKLDESRNSNNIIVLEQGREFLKNLFIDNNIMKPI